MITPLLRRAAAGAALVMLGTTPPSAVTAATPPTRPSPYAVCGTITEVEAAPSSDLLWTIKQCNNGVYKVVAYQPGEGWKPYTLPGTTRSTQINDLAVVSDTDVWALDLGRGPVRWNGTEWRLVTDDVFKPGDRLVRISATGPNNVWIVGYRPVAGTGDIRFMTWHWDGASWHDLMLPADAGTVRDIVTVNPTDVWMSSAATRFDQNGAFSQAISLHWDGTGWTEYPVGGRWSEVGTNLVASSPTSLRMTVLEETDETRLMGWNGQSWQQLPMPDDVPGAYTRLDTAPNGDVWSIHIDFSNLPQPFELAHTDGTTWDLSEPAPSVCNFRKMVQLRDLEVLSNDSVYAVGTCTFGSYFYTVAFHYDGNTWTRV